MRYGNIDILNRFENFNFSRFGIQKRCVIHYETAMNYIPILALDSGVCNSSYNFVAHDITETEQP
jgi:hypothetical protein